MGERPKNFIIASPSEKWMIFLNNRKLILAREKADQGLDLSVTLEEFTSLDQEPPEFLIGYEKEGKFFEEPINLAGGREFEVEGISALSYIKAATLSSANFSGALSIGIKNHFRTPVLSGVKKVNLNIQPGKSWQVTSGMFGDLYLPGPLKLYYLGWSAAERSYRSSKAISFVCASG